MAEFLSTLQSLFTVAFVVSSMLVMGMSLTVGQIFEPLRNLRLVVLALVASFVIVPATAVVLKTVIPMDPQLQIGLILMACAHGAPFLPKVTQIAKGDLAFSVGLMTLLIAATVIYLPIVLPLLLPGVSVDATQVALSLLGQMIVPLLIGLFVRWRWEAVADDFKKPLTQVSNVSLLLLLVLMLGLNIRNVIDLIGGGALIATVILTAVAAASGYLLGGPRFETRGVLAMGTALPNMAASFLIAGNSFADQPTVLIFLAGAGLIVMGIVFPLAAELGKRVGARSPAMTSSAEAGEKA